MWNRPTKWLLAMFCLLLLWLSYVTVSILTFPVGPSAEKADAAIVLGAGIRRSKPSPVFAERIHHAVELYLTDRIQKIIFTGGIGPNETMAESIVAATYAKQLGVEPDDIFTESKSTTTSENLRCAQPIIERETLADLLIVSDSLHLKRAMLIAVDIGMSASASATPTSRYQSLRTRLPFAFRETYYFHQYLVFSRWRDFC